MRLYHHPFSSNARRARMAALHLDVAHEAIVVDLAQGEQRKPEFLALNPAGRVPVLVDGDAVIPESHAIMCYLADKTKAESVYPTELGARADVHRWMFWCSHHWTPAVAVLNWENMVKPMLGMGAPDAQEIARGERLVTECAKLLDGHLAGKEWISQGRVTLADLSIVTPFMSRGPAKLPLDGYPNVEAWLARVQALDAWKKTSL